MDYPYQDIITPCLPNEQWKDILFFEGYYQVSNFGRVKSLDREIPHPRLKKQFIKGKILKQKVVQDSHQLGDKAMVSLQVALSLENKMQYKNVRRLVYCAFEKPLVFKKDGLYVINIDCDGYNNRLENLKAVSKSVKSKRAFNRKRVPESHLHMKYRANWKFPSYGGVSNRKPINKLDINSKLLLDSYESVTKAATENKLDIKEIINAAKGRRTSYAGYCWKYSAK